MSSDEGARPEENSQPEPVSPETVSSAQARASERAARRVTKASEKAARAQRRADAARQRALDAVQAGGFMESPTSVPITASESEEDHTGEATRTAQGAEEPLSEKEQETVSAPSESERAALPAKSRPRLLAMLVVATVVLLGCGTFAGAKWQDAREELRAEENISAASDQAAEAAKSIVTDMFTYDWQSVGPKLDGVQPRLTGAAEEEFRTRSRAAAESAAKQAKASVFATVAAVAPTKIESADSVTLLMMLNQMISTEKDPKAQSSASRLTVIMNRVEGGEWKLAKLEAI